MMHGVVFIRADRSQTAFGSTLPALTRVRMRRAASYVAVIGVGLTIGLVLGTIAALMSGLIMLC